LEPREESIQDYWGFYIGKYCKLIIIWAYLVPINFFKIYKTPTHKI
jgi:hypothetical protein